MSELRLAPETKELVWFTGPDAVRFLNDLLSQEIAAIPTGSVVRSFLLGPRGKLDQMLWVLRGVERVGLICDAGRGDGLVSTLGRYRIRVKVDIEAPMSGWLVVGEGPVEAGRWSESDDGLVAGLPWNGPAITFIVGSQPELTPITQHEMDRIYVEALEPRFGTDVDETTIPQETGLVDQAVDFEKGCFLGQELVARIDSRGHVNWTLRQLRFEGPPADPGTEVLSGGRSVGTITSVAGEIALARVRREVEPGEMVEAGGVPAVLTR